MIFLVIFATWVVSVNSSSNVNLQLAQNQHKISSALCAAESGLELGKYTISLYMPVASGDSEVTEAQADTTWEALWQHVRDSLNNVPTLLDGQTVGNPVNFTDVGGDGEELIIPEINFGSYDTGFQLRLYRYDSEPFTVKLQAIGLMGTVERKINIDYSIQREAGVLKYAVAGRGRMWLTGNSTIHGDIFSTWDNPAVPPFNLTSDSRVHGTINTVLTRQQIEDAGYQLETLDENGNPIFDFESDPSIAPLLDENGEPLYDPFNYRVYSYADEIQGYHRNIHYDQPGQEYMPGLDIDDYDTDCYNSGLASIPECPTVDRETEYFPHVAGDYSQPSSYTSRQLDRHVYEGETFTNAYLPNNRNALFRNCTFDEVLYVDCSKSAYSNYNNVRFENCTFNGIIVTDVPEDLKWKDNCLYFTGEATFNNTSSIQEATILAPHFNVDLGNTNPVASDNNILTGAIVGGIVDVRGNAQIYGTIISMCDTSQWSSGYVTNIGATLGDGGSETTEPGDVGVISITPDEDKMLPSGIMSPVVIRQLQGTYCEVF
jgi:hypothetical protein